MGHVEVLEAGRYHEGVESLDFVHGQVQGPQLPQVGDGPRDPPERVDVQVEEDEGRREGVLCGVGDVVVTHFHDLENGHEGEVWDVAQAVPLHEQVQQ